MVGKESLSGYLLLPIILFPSHADKSSILDLRVGVVENGICPTIVVLQVEFWALGCLA